MNDIVFSYDDYRRLVEDFAEEIPRLLSEHPSTASLALEIERLRLQDSLESRFNVAIIGQMRVGKSTLLNALIGQDLAPTGVEETTATVNWFTNDDNGSPDHFRVHWCDGTTEDKPLSEVNDWLGQGEHTSQTVRLDFFSNSRFLKKANIVDTPGTRAVIDRHVDVTRAFLAEKLERESLAHGCKADAVVYVVNPVGRESDDRMLQVFSEQTRLPGASPYNGIAVVQKWEHLEPDPIAEVEKKCARLKTQFANKVSEVIPTSGLLARVAKTASSETWDTLVTLAQNSSPDAFEELCEDADFFADKIDGAGLPAENRRHLLSAMPWPALKFSLKLAHSHNIKSGPSLKDSVYEASGLERLNALLESRFFARSGLIKANTILRKAMEPCDQAILELSQIEKQRKGDKSRGAESLRILQDHQNHNPELGKVAQHIEGTMGSVFAELEQVKRLRSKLDSEKALIMENFKALDEDVMALASLDALDEDALPEDLSAELRALFGVNGEHPWNRIGCPHRPGALDDLVDDAEERLVFWNGEKHRHVGRVAKLCGQAAWRLEQVIEALENMKGLS